MPIIKCQFYISIFCLFLGRAVNQGCITILLAPNIICDVTIKEIIKH